MLSSTLDVEAFAWSADWYKNEAQKYLGSNLGQNFRLWYMDNSGHVSPRNKVAETHVVNHDGAMQALLDLDAWVREEAAPPADSGYHITADTQVLVADNVAQRKGIQPTIALSIGVHPSVLR